MSKIFMHVLKRTIDFHCNVVKVNSDDINAKRSKTVMIT